MQLLAIFRFTITWDRTFLFPPWLQNVHCVLESTWHCNIWRGIQTPLASTTMGIVASEKSHLHTCICWDTVLGFTGLWSSAHRFSILLTYVSNPVHSQLTPAPPFETCEYLTALACSLESHTLHHAGMHHPGMVHEKPWHLLSRKSDLKPQHTDVRTQGPFSKILTSFCLSGFSFKSSLPLKVLVYILFFVCFVF